MNSYLLLRDNEERGPYSFEELQSLPLKRNDYVWVTGRSLSWERPADVPELNQLVHEDNDDGTQPEPGRKIKEEQNVYGSLPVTGAPEQYSIFETSSPYRSQAENFSGSSPVQPSSQKENLLSKLSWVFVSIAILVTAFFITKMVNGSDQVVMPKKPTASSGINEVLDNTENFQNALTREIIFVPDSTKKPPKKLSTNDLKKLLDVTNNDYKVGLFGGINDLELTIENNSNRLVDKIDIQVDYLKPNGDVIESETVSAKNIKPNGSKTISVPSSSRGVKIKHKILDIEAHEFKPVQSEI